MRVYFLLSELAAVHQERTNATGLTTKVILKSGHRIVMNRRKAEALINLWNAYIKGRVPDGIYSFRRASNKSKGAIERRKEMIRKRKEHYERQGIPDPAFSPPGRRKKAP